jgi:diguanylate cyclase (GGDEF)-like protein
MVVRFLVLLWLGVLATCAVPGPVAARTPSLPVCIAPDAPGITPAKLLKGDVPLACGADQHRFGPGDFWAVSRLPPVLEGEHAVRVLSLLQGGLTLNVVYADGSIARMQRDSRALSRHIQLGAIVEFALPPRAAPPVALVWQVHDAANVRGILLEPTIVTPAESIAANLRLAAVYGGLAGLILALLVYHLALWGALRHSFQFAYCVMLGVLLVYTLSSSGALAWALPGIDNNDRIRVNYASLGLAAASAVVFARTFFELRVLDGWLRTATLAAALTLGTAGLQFAVLSHLHMRAADLLYSYMLLGGFCVAIPILWRAWSRRSNYLWLFAAAWAAPIGFAFARIAAALHWIPVSFWLDNSTVLSMAAEALLSSIAISYRIRLISDERDEALQNEAIARRLADTDVLTGLLNRRAFLAQAVGRGGQQVLHVIDVDHFKSVNETLGHDGGDQVLRQVADVLRHAAPAGALVARIGGEEFAIVTTPDQPLDPDRLLTKLRSARMPFDLVVTASVGSCVGPLHTDVAWKRLYQAADRALFAAKTGGRDRVRTAPALALAA